MRKVAFRDCHVALLVGARPRGPGMERKDLLLANAQIFSAQGKALNEVADRKLRVLVVGNPANTNALIASRNAPGLDAAQLHRHDAPGSQPRAVAAGGEDRRARQRHPAHDHLGQSLRDPVSGHQSRDRSKASRRKGLVDQKWIEEQFIPTVQQRGAAVIKARGSSSAASAASAAIDHVRTWVLGHRRGRLDQHGHAVRRQLRHRGGTDLLLSGHLQRTATTRSCRV